MKLAHTAALAATLLFAAGPLVFGAIAATRENCDLF